MKARDVFGIVLRTLGVLVLIYGLYWGGWCLTALIKGDSQHLSMYLPVALLPVIAALILICFARYIVRLSYPRNRDDSEE